MAWKRSHVRPHRDGPPVVGPTSGYSNAFLICVLPRQCAVSSSFGIACSRRLSKRVGVEQDLSKFFDLLTVVPRRSHFVENRARVPDDYDRRARVRLDPPKRSYTGTAGMTEPHEPLAVDTGEPAEYQAALGRYRFARSAKIAANAPIVLKLLKILSARRYRTDRPKLLRSPALLWRRSIRPTNIAKGGPRSLRNGRPGSSAFERLADWMKGSPQ